VLFSLGGCMTLTEMDWDRPPPADWPELKVQIHYVAQDQILDICKGVKFKFGDIPKGCTRLLFTQRICNVFLVDHDPELLKHEVGHCSGYDHPGDSRMRDIWTQYKFVNQPKEK
jgi:hypothetical protein